MKERMTSLKQEVDLRSDSNVQHLETIDQLKRKMSRLQQERDAASRDKTKEVKASKCILFLLQVTWFYPFIILKQNLVSAL